MFIYSGFRISELLGLKTANTDLEKGTFQGGIKSAAGKNRIVPIHSLITEMVERKVKEGNEFLFAYNGKRYSKIQYYSLWNEILERLGIDKTPHECGHTFESLLNSAGANRKCIDLIMEHKSKGTGQRVYTHKALQELKDAIELIKRKKQLNRIELISR